MERTHSHFRLPFTASQQAIYLTPMAALLIALSLLGTFATSGTSASAITCINFDNNQCNSPTSPGGGFCSGDVEVCDLCPAPANGGSGQLANPDSTTLIDRMCYTYGTPEQPRKSTKKDWPLQCAAQLRYSMSLMTPVPLIIHLTSSPKPYHWIFNMAKSAFPGVAKWSKFQPQFAAMALIVVACSPPGWTAPDESQPVITDHSVEEHAVPLKGTAPENVGVGHPRSNRDDRLSVPLLNEVPDPTDLDRKVAMMFDPFARIPHSVAGTMIAQYRLPIENTDEYSFAMVIYNPQLRASCKVHSFDGAVHLIDPNGNIYRGSVSGGKDLSLELTGTDEWPFSNRLIVPFMPSSAVEDLYIYNRDGILNITQRTSIGHIRVADETKEVMKTLPGVEVTWRPGTAVDRRVPQDTEQLELPAIRYELDAGGRLVAYNRVGEAPKVIQYRGNTPQHFPLPDPAHGGNWRLQRWQFIEGHNHEALFTPESIRAIIDAWGMQ